VGAAEVPRHLAAGDLGLALRQPTFSMQAVAPIKLGEYLLCGVPVLATRGIGDSEALVPDTVGRLLDTMTPASLDAAATWFVNDVLPARGRFRADCREQGQRCFGIEAMVDAYAEAIVAKEPAAP
jgi:glycosyltransferase involved in cell wall biosynthesis